MTPKELAWAFIKAYTSAHNEPFTKGSVFGRTDTLQNLRARLGVERDKIMDDSAALFEFAKECLSSTTVLFDLGLDALNKEELGALVPLALHMCARYGTKDTLAESVLDTVARQFPELLHQDIRDVFQLSCDSPYGAFEKAWRGLDRASLEFFKNKLTSTEWDRGEASRLERGELTIKRKLLKTLLASRDKETIEFVYQYMLENRPLIAERLKNREDYQRFLDVSIEDVGFTRRGGEIVSCCPSASYHFVFQKYYYFRGKRRRHATETLEPVTPCLEFGGVLEEGENPLCHLITLEPIPAGIKISGLRRLVLGVHLRETDMSIPFYQHDQNGYPVKIKDASNEVREEDRCHNFPIKPSTVAFAPTPQRWILQEWEDGNGNMFKLGGEPAWIQSPDIQTCPVCGEKMDFLMQLDNGLPDMDKERKDGEVWWGSGGMCYVLWCDKCNVSAYVMQCT
ncbi:MAG: hypothetical protein LBS89_04435 [Zoogloeaceae bacterium]|nr:hypothetical protein [Zoogloeaceae bacterium]